MDQVFLLSSNVSLVDGLSITDGGNTLQTNAFLQSHDSDYCS